MSLDYIAPRLEKSDNTRPRIKYIDSRWAVVTALWKLIPDPLWRRLQLGI